MELNLNSLQRDWIVGISGGAFAAKVQSLVGGLEAIPNENRQKGVLITETDPVEFAATFFAAVMTQTPVILGNPKWGRQEWVEFGELVAPVKVFGSIGTSLVDGANRHEDRLKAGLQPGAILIPTGGTTGGVKLAIHGWESLVAASLGVQAFMGGAPIHSCCLLPLYHVSGLMQLVRSFVSGGQIRFNDAELEGYCLSLVPTQLQRLLDDSTQVDRLRSARAIFVGGAALPEAVGESARRARLPVMPVYGMTETAAMCAAVPIDDFLNRSEAGARLIGDTRIALEVDGRIRIRSTALFQGYHGREPVDLSLGYLTGDLGKWDDEGRLRVLGRADRLIITGGEKVDPAEVEAALLRIEGIRAARVRGEPDVEWGQRVVAQIATAQVLSDSTLKAALAPALSPHKIPKQIDRVDTADWK